MMILFTLDAQSGVAPYLQIVQQVKNALRLGIVQPGDQLPTVREVVARLTINPNTVLKAYRELESAGLVGGRPGQGTFILRALPMIDPRELATLRLGLERWLKSAAAAGLDSEGVQALIASTLQRQHREETA